MADRKIIEKIALPALVLVFIIMFGNMANKTGILGRKPPPAPVPKISAGLMGPGLGEVKAPEAAKKKAPPGDIGWGRDPFLPYEASFQEADSIQNLRLMGITSSLDKKTYSAIINDELVQIGSRVGKFELISIKKDRVIVKDDKARYELKLAE